MKHILSIIARYALGALLLALAAVSLITMLAYYQEAFAMLPGAVFAVCFIGSLACFIRE